MNVSLLLLLPLQIGVVLLSSQLLGYLTQRLGQPKIIGHMAVGLLLGASLLGSLWPQAYQWLFLPTQTPFLALLGQIGLALFMFKLGLEFELNRLDTVLPRALRIAGWGFVLSFALGGALARVLLEWGTGNYGSGYFGNVSALVAVSFLGLAFAVTAFPVLAKILQELGLERSRVGILTLLSASLGDLVAWVLLTVILTLLGAGAAVTGQHMTLELGKIALYVIIMILSIKPLVGWIWPRVSKNARVGVVAVLLLLSVFFSEKVGLHTVLGAFLLGFLFPRGLVEARHFKPLEPLTQNLLLPLYFAYAGLAVVFSQFNQPSSWGLLLLIVGLATVGKVGGCFWAARAGGETVPEALKIGVLMNTRGLMELVLLHIGLERGIITQKLYTLMVLMTLITTTLTPLLFTALRRRFPQLEGG